MSHRYAADPQSGAGNCVCGASEHHRRHPHDFRRALPLAATAAILSAGTLDLCVCGLPAEAEPHLASLAASPESEG